MKKEVPWEIGTRKTGMMNKEIMHSNLLDFKEAMDKQDVKYAFIFGGLLGLIREGKLIDWDDDVEFACFFDDHRKMKGVVEELKSKDFYIPDRNECPLHDHFFIKGGEKIELWWFTRVNEKWIYDNHIIYSAEHFDTLDEIEFLGKKWKVPHNPEKFLELTYGNWKIPNKNASYIIGKDK